MKQEYKLGWVGLRINGTGRFLCQDLEELKSIEVRIKNGTPIEVPEYPGGVSVEEEDVCLVYYKFEDSSAPVHFYISLEDFIKIGRPSNIKVQLKYPTIIRDSQGNIKRIDYALKEVSN